MLCPQELTVIVTVVILLLLIVLYSSKRRRRPMFSTDELYEPDHTNMRHTNLNGQRMPSQKLPSPYEGGVSEFMKARYKVIADDALGDNTEPLNDICVAGFKNPAMLAGKFDSLPKTSQTFWNTTKSTPRIANDDKQLEHVAAELQTPDHRVRMAGKSKHFLPHTGGKSRLNFSSFENGTNEAPFRQ